MSWTLEHAHVEVDSRVAAEHAIKTMKRLRKPYRSKTLIRLRRKDRPQA